MKQRMRRSFLSQSTYRLLRARATGLGTLALMLLNCAFMNVESIRQNPKPGGSGLLQIKGNGQSGNTDKLMGEFEVLHLQRDEFNEWLGAGRYRYGESQHIKDTHLGNLHLRYTRIRPGHSYPEAFVQTEFDEFRDLKRRDLFGLGFRHLLQREETFALYLGTGAFYEHENFESEVNSAETLRANFYFSLVRTFNPQVSANLITYFQPEVRSLNNTRIQVDSALAIRLVERLSLSLEYDLQFDNEPPPGVEKTDSTYMVSLGYSY